MVYFPKSCFDVHWPVVEAESRPTNLLFIKLFDKYVNALLRVASGFTAGAYDCEVEVVRVQSRDL